MIDGRPLAVLVNHLPYEIGARIPVGELAERPLIDLIEERAGVVVEWASEVFQAVGADDEISQLLEVDMLTPLLKVTLTVYSAKGTVVNLADVFYRCDRYNHRGFLTRDHRIERGSGGHGPALVEVPKFLTTVGRRAKPTLSLGSSPVLHDEPAQTCADQYCF